MPFIDTTDDADLPVLFNVVNSVGRNAKNKADDVRMVQFMLSSYYVTRKSRPRGVMVVDGLCGPLTRGWIRRFQLDYQPNLSADERIDRAKGTAGSISHKFYTIVALNLFLRQVNFLAWSRIPALFPMTVSDSLPADDPEYGV